MIDFKGLYMGEKLKLYAYCRESTKMQVEGGNLEN